MCTFLRTRARNGWTETVEEGKQVSSETYKVIPSLLPPSSPDRDHKSLTTDILPEGFRQEVREQEWIQSEFFALPGQKTKN